MKIFLTGAGGGIGQAIYKTLLKSGIEVIAPRSKDLNLSGEFDVSEYPEVDGFIHCAGINPVSQLDDIKVSDILTTYSVNTISFVELCSKLKIKNNSNIIAIGSLYATETRDGRLSYTMSKHALLGAVKTIAIEKSNQRVKVNMISPGFVDTPLTRKNNTKERKRLQLAPSFEIALIKCRVIRIVIFRIIYTYYGGLRVLQFCSKE